MTAWLLSGGTRCCPVTSFVSPGEFRLPGGQGTVPSIIAMRIDAVPSSMDRLAVEFDDGGVLALHVYLLRRAESVGWDLVAALVGDEPAVRSTREYATP